MLKSKHTFRSVVIDPIETNINLTRSLTTLETKQMFILLLSEYQANNNLKNDTDPKRDLMLVQQGIII